MPIPSKSQHRGRVKLWPLSSQSPLLLPTWSEGSLCCLLGILSSPMGGFLISASSSGGPGSPWFSLVCKKGCGTSSHFLPAALSPCLFLTYNRSSFPASLWGGPWVDVSSPRKTQGGRKQKAWAGGSDLLQPTGKGLHRPCGAAHGWGYTVRGYAPARHQYALPGQSAGSSAPEPGPRPAGPHLREWCSGRAVRRWGQAGGLGPRFPFLNLRRKLALESSSPALPSTSSRRTYRYHRPPLSLGSVGSWRRGLDWGLRALMTLIQTLLAGSRALGPLSCHQPLPELLPELLPQPCGPPASR